MKKILILVTLFYCFQLTASCTLYFSSLNLCGNLTWTTPPNFQNKSSFEFYFYGDQDIDKKAQLPAQSIKFFTWMKMDMGHEHAGPKFLTTMSDTFVFSSNQVKFLDGMEGKWYLGLKVVNQANQVLETILIPVDIAP